VIGLDGADWSLLDGYASDGTMPNLATLLAEGRSGVLQTEEPPLSPLLWTTMMTGVGPLEHRILDFTRHAPGTTQREPITSDERRAPAVWDMVGDRGGSVAIFGLWATHPAEPVRGLMVSDRLFSFQRREEPPPGVVFPRDREAWARQAIANAEGAVTLAEMRRFLPWLSAEAFAAEAARPDPYAHPVSALRRIVVETQVHDLLARDGSASAAPDLTVLYLQGSDSIGHVFAAYAPPRQAQVSAADFDLYQGVPRAHFQDLDRRLGGWRDEARRRQARLLVVSDHGFRWREHRPRDLSSLGQATAAEWHAPEGVSLVWGPGITPVRERSRGGIRQVAATILALLGLPPSLGIEAPPLLGIAASPQAARDDRTAFAARPRATTPAAAPDPAALEKLRALGYLSGEGAPAAPAGDTRTASSFNNEGLILRAAGKRDAARAAFEEALRRDPQAASAAWNLSELLFEDGQDDASDQALLRLLSGPASEVARRVSARASAYMRRNDHAKARGLADAAVARRVDVAELWLLRGSLRLQKGECPSALGDFERAARLAPRNALAAASRGAALLCLGRKDAARASFELSLKLDPDQPELRRQLTAGR
jgi:tetratricopeptide (TPR) repeat protein